MNTHTIQRQLKFVSRHTLLKYMNELLNYELVDFKRNLKDRRQKQFTLTDNGYSTLESIHKERMDNYLKCLFDSYGKSFLLLNPVYVDSKEWRNFKQEGYSYDLVESIELRVFSNILRILDSD